MGQPSYLIALCISAGLLCGCGGRNAPPRGAADNPSPPAFSGGDIDQMRRRHAELAAKYTVRDRLALEAMTAPDRAEFVALDRALFRFALAEKLGDALRLSDLPQPPPGTYQEQPDTLDSDSTIVLKAEGPWRFLRLATENIIPVPDGWEIHEAGVESYLFFPPIEMTPTGPRKPDARQIAVKFAVRDARRITDLRQTFLNENQQTIASEGIVVGSPIEQFDGRGYFTIHAPRTGLLSVVAFTPIKAASGRGMSCLASAPAAKWAACGPILKAMLSRWHWEGGQNLSLTLDLSRIAPPAAQRSATPAL
jgi:hypothetical protein